MKIKEAVKLAAVMLQSDELAQSLENENLDPETLSEELSTELDLLVRCAGLVLGELSAGDFPLVKTVTANAKNKTVEYASLGENVTDIVRVEKDGMRLPIREYTDSFTLPVSGEVEVTYAYAPAKAGYSDDSPYSGEKPSARLVAYGIAREYCLISGMTDEAAMWDARFASACEDERKSRRERRVLRRRWL